MDSESSSEDEGVKITSDCQNRTKSKTVSAIIQKSKTILASTSTVKPHSPKHNIGINDNQVAAMFDTSLEVSLIDFKIIKKLKIEIEEHKYSFVGADNSALHTLGHCKLKIKIKLGWTTKEIKYKFIVVSNLIYPVIIGVDLMAKLKMGIV